MTPTNADLRQFIIQFFSDEELDGLCFDYFREVYQNFTGSMTKSRKAILLIGYCETRGRLADLYAAVERERMAMWREKFGAPPLQKPGFSEETRFLTRDPRQVFLSHATADAAFAHRLASDLRAEGWRVWIAPDSIRPGEKWVEAIDRGLETSGVFVVALTPAAVASKWVRTETNVAIDLHHADEIRFISLDVAEVRLTGLWRSFQHIPFRPSYEGGLDALLRWLEEDEDPLPNPPPQGEGVRSPSPREGLGEGASDPLPKGEEVRSPSPREGLGEGAASASRPTRPPAQERRVKEEQWRQLQALAHEIAAELGRQSGDDETHEVFRRFNQAFGLTTYKKLPRRRFAEGLAFLTAWRDEVVATTGQDPLPNPLPPGEGVQSPSRREGLGEGTLSFPGYRVLSAERIIHEKTGIKFVRVPAGPFVYGSADSDKMAYNNEKPQRTVNLPEYWIGRAPVTNAQYKRFLDANPKHPAPWDWNERDRKPPSGKENHPVVNIRWHDAQAFCDWAGLALPAEEQWEKAARGTDGRLWPWGNEKPTADERCNFNQNVGETTPVGRYSPQGDSPYGCVDMAGNVWEWAASWYDTLQVSRVLRGGSWYTDARSCRCALRSGVGPNYKHGGSGMRVLVALS